MRTLAKIAGLMATVTVALVAILVVLDRVIPEKMARAQIDLQRSFSGLQLKQTSIPGFDIPYLEGGPADGDTLVLVHGIGADKDNFDRVARYLTPRMRVISIDLPGFGDASKPAGADYGIDKQVERLNQFLAALKIQRVHLGGSSMGGWIVASYTAAHPQQVASLWLLDAAGVATAKSSAVFQAYTERGEYLLFAKTPQDFDRVLHTVMSEPPYLPWSVKQLVTQRAMANYELHTRIFRDMVTSQKPVFLESRVAGLATPTLITWGDEDGATDVSAAKILHQLMPKSQLHILPGIGHLPHLEASSETAQAYLDFRKNLGR